MFVKFSSKYENLFFYDKNGNKKGPYSLKQLNELCIPRETLILIQGCEDKVPLKDLPEVDRARRKRKVKSIIRRILLCMVCVVVIFCVVVFVSEVYNYVYPKCLTSFYDKALMRLNISNNSLCAELIEKADSARNANLPELERYYYYVAEEVGTTDDDMLFKIGSYYFSNDVREYSVARSLFLKIKDQGRADVLSHEAWCLYKENEENEAITKAQQALLKDSTDRLATVTLYCIFNYREDWKNCINWADKSLEIDPNFAQTYFFKSRAQYELGMFNEAKDTYSKAVEIDSTDYHVSKFAYIMGMPFTVQNVDVANVDYQGNIINRHVDYRGNILNGYGESIYHYEAQYIKPRIKISSPKVGSYEILVKCFWHNGNSYQYNYSYSSKIDITSETAQYITLDSWGIDNWDDIHYKFEFYYGDKKIAEKIFKLM